MILSDLPDPFSFSDVKNARFKLTEGDKVLLAMKTANLCSLVYSSTAVDGVRAGPLEEAGLKLLDIVDYKVWTYTVKQEKSVLGHSFGSLVRNETSICKPHTDHGWYCHVSGCNWTDFECCKDHTR